MELKPVAHLAEMSLTTEKSNLDAGKLKKSELLEKLRAINTSKEDRF